MTVSDASDGAHPAAVADAGLEPADVAAEKSAALVPDAPVRVASSNQRPAGAAPRPAWAAELCIQGAARSAAQSCAAAEQWALLAVPERPVPPKLLLVAYLPPLLAARPLRL
jgi:hypothetical protein